MVGIPDGTGEMKANKVQIDYSATEPEPVTAKSPPDSVKKVSRRIVEMAHKAKADYRAGKTSPVPPE